MPEWNLDLRRLMGMALALYLTCESKFYQYFVFTKKKSNNLSHFASVQSLRIAYLWKRKW